MLFRLFPSHRRLVLAHLSLAIPLVIASAFAGAFADGKDFHATLAVALIILDLLWLGGLGVALMLGKEYGGADTTADLNRQRAQLGMAPAPASAAALSTVTPAALAPPAQASAPTVNAIFTTSVDATLNAAPEPARSKAERVPALRPDADAADPFTQALGQRRGL